MSGFAPPVLVTDMRTEVYAEVMTRVTVDLDEDLYERLRAAAYAEHRPMAEIVRDLVRQSLPDRATEGTS